MNEGMNECMYPDIENYASIDLFFKKVHERRAIFLLFSLKMKMKNGTDAKTTTQ